MELEDKNKVLHALFSKAMEVNIDNDTFSIIKVDSEKSIQCNNFSEWLAIFVEEGNVHPEDIEKFKKFFSYENLSALMLHDNTPFYVRYRRHVKDGYYLEVVAYVMKSCKSTEKTNIMLLGIMPIDWIGEC